MQRLRQLGATVQLDVRSGPMLAEVFRRIRELHVDEARRYPGMRLQVVEVAAGGKIGVLHTRIDAQIRADTMRIARVSKQQTIQARIKIELDVRNERAGVPPARGVVVDVSLRGGAFGRERDAAKPVVGQQRHSAGDLCYRV